MNPFGQLAQKIWTEIQGMQTPLGLAMLGLAVVIWMLSRVAPRWGAQHQGVILSVGGGLVLLGMVTLVVPWLLAFH